MNSSDYVEHILLVELEEAHSVEEMIEMEFQSPAKACLYLGMDRRMFAVKVILQLVMAMPLKEVYRIMELLVMEVLVTVLVAVVEMNWTDQCCYVGDRKVQ